MTSWSTSTLINEEMTFARVCVVVSSRISLGTSIARSLDACTIARTLGANLLFCRQKLKYYDTHNKHITYTHNRTSDLHNRVFLLSYKHTRNVYVSTTGVVITSSTQRCEHTHTHTHAHNHKQMNQNIIKSTIIKSLSTCIYTCTTTLLLLRHQLRLHDKQCFISIRIHIHHGRSIFAEYRKR